MIVNQRNNLHRLCAGAAEHITNKNCLYMDMINMKYVVASVVYSFLGVVILLIAFIVIEKITPENIRKELIEKGNIAVAIVAAAFILAIAVIVSSAIHG